MRMGGQRKRGRAGAQEEVSPRTVVVVVDEPAGAHNVYEYDQRRQVLWLSEISVRDGASPWEFGHVLNTRSASGQPLPAAVLVRVPTFPGCLVRARVLGAARFVQDGQRHHLILGVPDVDADLKGMDDVSGLSKDQREAAQAWAPGFDGWLGAEETARMIREAGEAYWQAKAQAENVRTGAAWKVAALPGEIRERGEGEPHTWAEYLVPYLPTRFQRHVEEVLLPEERILFFVERPEFALPGPLAPLRGRKLRRGLLVITNRQVLIMLDSLPPDSTLVDWGYVAKVTALERIESAWSERRDSTVEFNIAIRAQGGTERYSLLFPEEHAEALEEGVQLLDAFARPSEHALARVYDGSPDAGDRIDRQELLAKYAHLGQLIEDAGDEDVLAAAGARGPDGRGLGPALAVTPTRAIVFTGAKAKAGAAHRRVIPIASVSSVETVRSVLGCRLDIFVPGEEGVERITLKYDYPDSPAFVHAFTTLRHLLGRPVSASRGVC